jgi:long-subunit acyl-CoA synthetase (AMP-forming)
MGQQRTIARLWQDAVARWPGQGTAYLDRRGSTWHPVTWSEAAATVEARACGLRARGLRAGDAFAILARTTLDW